MHDLKKIRKMSCTTIDEVINLIRRSFPPICGYAAEYFVGENEETHKQFLCFLIRTNMFGNIYYKAVEIESSRVAEEYEEEFVGAIIGDFFLLGTAFITNNNIHKQTINQIGKNAVKNVSHDPLKEGILNGNFSIN